MLIKVNSLTAYYENREIFKNLSFSVNAGDYLCITGENGSGKTTLMRLILGLDVKHTGSVELVNLKKNEIGYMPQRSLSEADFPASVNEVIMSGFCGKSFLGMLSKSQKKKAAENMKILGIENLKKRYFSYLSVGQQQKVMLCRAMCAASKLILLDEPTAGLDSASEQEFYSLLKRINKSGIAVIMISHDIIRAKKEGSHILDITDNGYTYSENKGENI